jgi:hypothetical protein
MVVLKEGAATADAADAADDDDDETVSDRVSKTLCMGKQVSA